MRAGRASAGHRPARAPLSVRVGAVLLASAYAYCSLGVGLDADAVYRPALAAWVPAAFAAQSLAVTANDQLSRHDYAGAQASASRLVAARPIDAQSTALLGASALMAGGADDKARAERIFTVAAQFGWRQPITQAYWVDRAMALGDYDTAALRVDAMLRNDPDLHSNAAFMGPIESSAAMRDALVERLRASPGWKDGFLSDVAAFKDDQLSWRAASVATAALHGIRLGCAGVSPIVVELAKRNRIDQAYTIWQGHCPSQAGLLSDAGFDGLKDDAPASPFLWQTVGSGDLAIDRREVPGGGVVLSVQSSAPVLVPVIRQLVVVPAGHYRLSWRAHNGDGSSASRVAPYIGCARELIDSAGEANTRGDFHWLDVTIDNHCQAHWLQFMQMPGSSVVELSNIALVPSAGAPSEGPIPPQ